MKKTLCVLLCALWLWIGLPTAKAQPVVRFPALEPGAAKLAQPVTDIMVKNETLYLLWDGVWQYHPGEAEPSPVLVEPFGIESSQLCLVRGAGSLMVLDKTSGCLGTLQENEWHWSDPLPDWESMRYWDSLWGGTETRGIFDATLIDDKLYARIDVGENTAGDYELWCFDPSEKKRSVIWRDASIESMRPYQGDYQLVLLADAQGYKISTMDLASGTLLQTILEADYGTYIASALYDSPNDCIYVVTDQFILPVTANNAFGEPIAILTSPRYDNASQGAIMPSGLVAAIDANGFMGIYDLSAPLPTRTLRVMGLWRDDVFEEYCLSNPEAPAIFIESPDRNAQKYMEDIQRGFGEDIYVLNASDIGYLMEKGYLADLSESQPLWDTAQRMYPWAQEAMMMDGKLYAFPYRVRTGFWTADPQLLDTFGLLYPTTMDDFFGVIEAWAKDGRGMNGDYVLYNPRFNKQLLASLVLELYITQYYQPGALLKFNTPILCKALERVHDLPEDPNDSSTYVLDQTAHLIEFRRTPFDPHYFQFGDRHPIIYPPPTFEEGKDVPVRGTIQVYVVNPNSENLDLAMRYLAIALQRMDAATQYLLRPDLNEPVRDPDSVAKISELQQANAELNERLASVDPADIRQVKEKIAHNNAIIQFCETFIWLIDEKALTRYRGYAPQIALRGELSLYRQDAKEQLEDLLQAYLGDQITLEQMLEKMDRVSKMMYMELM